MKKNYRKIPSIINAKIRNFQNDNFEICILKKVRENELVNFPYSMFNFNNNEVEPEEVIPQMTRGAFSRKNINGYKIVFRDQEKISKTWYAGERPIYGNWSKGSFSLFITKRVFPSVTIAPKELSFSVSILDIVNEENENYYILKINVNEILNRTQVDFEENLFFNLNLMQENFGDADVFETNLTREQYLNTLIVNWEIFPPGVREDDIQRLVLNRRNLTPDYVRNLNERYDILMSLNPVQIISGSSGMRNYFGVKYSNSLVVFENLQYGNAIYLLFENWEELSRLSRTELLRRPEDQFCRIEHKFGWQTKLGRTIEGRRNK